MPSKMLRASVISLIGLTVNLLIIFGFVEHGRAQFTFELIHEFIQDGQNPRGELIQANDGLLYGTTQNGGRFGQGTAYRVNGNGSTTVLHSFRCTATDGCLPQSRLIEASDGFLYGTTLRGGAFARGTVYRIDKDGNNFTLLHSFDCVTHGCDPAAGLIEVVVGGNHYFYGTAINGGPSGASGMVYRIDTSGNFTLLHSFICATDGCGPSAGLVEASDGLLYGTTPSGGPPGTAGTVYKIDTAGNFTPLHSFNCATDGCAPIAGLTEVSVGGINYLYGTARSGGSHNAGSAYRIDTSGNFALLHSFDCATDGCFPLAGLIQASDGFLYGTTPSGGPSGANGTAYRIDTAGNFTLLHSFDCATDGCQPLGGLVETNNGLFYGVTFSSGPGIRGTVYKVNSNGAFNIVYAFGQVPRNPRGELIQASNGYLYGTTQIGGAFGQGTVYRVNSDGSTTTLHSFRCITINGCLPISGLTEGSNGLLYGTTVQGGAFTQGTVYQIDTDGNFTLLHSLNCSTDGCFPFAGLIQASDEFLYGTTQSGGPSGASGTAYRIDTAGNFALLHSFNCATDGCAPFAGMIQASDGLLYGTTQFGGPSGGARGTVYKIDTAGNNFTVLHSFNCTTDGCQPTGGLVEVDVSGIKYLYGTTRDSGPSAARGTAFRIDTAGSFNLLHAFDCATDGCFPLAGLIQASDGFLYGTTQANGPSGSNGTAYRIDTAGNFTLLHPFDCTTDGCTLLGGIFEASDNNLYGGAFSGGIDGGGTLYRLIRQNSAPTADAGGPYSVNEGGSIQLNAGSSSDPDGDSLTYEWDFDYDGATFDVDASGVAPIFSAAGQDGPLTRTVAVRVSDGLLATIATAQLDVVNVAPVADTGGPYSVNEGGSAPLGGNGSDVPGDTLTFAWDLDNNGSFETAGQNPTFSAAGLDGPSAQTVVLRVCDDDGDCGTNSTTVNIVNVAPTVALTGPATADEGETKEYTFTVSDPGIDTFALKAGSPSCGTGGSLVTGSVAVTPAGGSFSCQFPEGPSNPTVTVQVTDSDGADSNVSSVAVTVNNVAPTVVLTGAASANEGETKVYDFTVSDPNGDTFTLKAGFPTCGTEGNLVSGSLSTNAGGGSFSCQFPDGPANTDVSVQVTDSDGDDSTISSVGVTVNNVAPTVILSGANSANEGESKEYTFTVTEPGADTFTIKTGFPNCGIGGVLSGSGAGSFTCQFPDGPATPNVTVQVTDSDGADSNVGLIAVSVVNLAPVANANGPYNVNEGSSTALGGNANDVASDTLTFAWDLDNNGSFETPGQNPTFSAASLDGPASLTVGFRVCDDDGGCGTTSTTVNVINVPPVANANGPYSVNEGGSIALGGSGSDIPGDVLTYEWDLDNNGSFETPGQNPTFSAASLDGPASRTVVLRVCDDDNACGTSNGTVNILNAAPIVGAVAVAAEPSDEGSAVTASASFSDAGGADGPFSCTVDYGDGPVAATVAGSTCTGPAHVYPDNGSPVVTIAVTDKDNGSGNNSAAHTVNNVPPVINSIVGPADPIALANTATVTANFGDVGILDTHTCTFSWDDSSPDTVVNTAAGAGSCSASHYYNDPGVYTVAVTVTDKDGGSVSDIFEFVVIYDPSGGFVTGGGFIDSPAGAYVADPELTGRANFGFVSKYKKGANVPEGQTEFQFKVANLNFHSSVYEWLVVSGPKAQFKGLGTINGQYGSAGYDGYGFLLTATDSAQNGGGDVDKFRIKIWDVYSETVVYDNVIEAVSDDPDAFDPQAISGGSIVIHTPKGKK